MRQRQGRPPLPRDIARRERVVTFVTLAQRRDLEKLASASSQSISAVCHRLITLGLRHMLEKEAGARPRDDV